MRAEAAANQETSTLLASVDVSPLAPGKIFLVRSSEQEMRFFPPRLPLTIHRFFLEARIASRVCAAMATFSMPRAMVMAPGGPPDDLPV